MYVTHTYDIYIYDTYIHTKNTYTHIYKRNLQIVFIVAVPFCIPTRVNESYYCSTPSRGLGVISVLDFGHSNRHVVVSHCFDSCFPDDI